MDNFEQTQGTLFSCNVFSLSLAQKAVRWFDQLNYTAFEGVIDIFSYILLT